MVHVRDVNQVAYLDDSKATNVGATAASLDGLMNEKGGGFDRRWQTQRR